MALWILWLFFSAAAAASYGKHLYATHKGLLMQNPAPWYLRTTADSKSFLSSQQASPPLEDFVHVFVLDDGLQESHPELKGKIHGKIVVCEDSKTMAARRGEHGTQVASLIGGATLGISKSVSFHDVKVCCYNEQHREEKVSEDRNCNPINLISGLVAVMKAISDLRIRKEMKASKIPIISISLCSPEFLPSDTVENMVSNLISYGALVVVSAGNGASNACEFIPARMKNVVTVGASSADGTHASFSNFGECVDLWAPGVDILVADTFSPLGYSIQSGTSYAAPLVSGLAANIISLPGVHTVDSITKRLLEEPKIWRPSR